MTNVSEDGFWQNINGEWVPTELQNQALLEGAQPHQQMSNLTPGTMAMNATAHPGTWNAPPKNNGMKIGLIIAGCIVVGMILITVLAGVLFAWASSLAENNLERDIELIGTWTNPADTMVLESNGDVQESTGTFDSWYTSRSDVFFEEGSDYYYNFKYIVVDDVFFLAPYDESEQLLEEDCIAYIKGQSGSTESIYNERIEKADADGDVPLWCNPA
jgi:hypothetical protein